MTKNTENRLCECERINELEKENIRLNRMIAGLKINNQELTSERNKLLEELREIKSLGMFEFAEKYNSDIQCAEAGREFARALLGGA